MEGYRFVNDPAEHSNNSFLLDLITGGLRSVTGLIGKTNPQGVRITTPTATVGVRGTDFELSLLDKDTADAQAGLYNRVFEGTTFLENKDGQQIEVNANEVAFSPLDLLRAAQQFGLLNRMPAVFRNGQFDAALGGLQREGVRPLLEQLKNLNNNNPNNNNSPPNRLPGPLQNMLPGGVPGGNSTVPGVPGLNDLLRKR
jgi:hypothetical protein